MKATITSPGKHTNIGWTLVIPVVRLALLVVAALSMGLRYAVIQMVGWVNRMVEYSQSAPLSGAAVMTFDGGPPCEFCKIVTKELKTSDQNDKRAPGKPAICNFRIASCAGL
jgi:hypothetical protein